MKYKGLISLLIALMLITVGCGAKETKVETSGDDKEITETQEKDTNKEESKPEKSETSKPSEDSASSTENSAEEDKKDKEGHGEEGADDVSGASKKELKPLEFETMPEKVAVGTVGLTDLFNALEIDLVGVPSSRSYKIPERYADLPAIGMSMQPDMEILKSLDVDVFITDASLQQSLEESLQEKKINAAFVATSGYDDIMFSIASVGNAFGKAEKAGAMIGKMKATEKAVMEKIQGKEQKKVMIIFGTPESFMLATDMAYVGDLANRLNLENVTDGMEIKSPYLPFSIETVVAMNPDVILRFTHADPETSRKMFEKEFAENPVWNALNAVKNDKVFDLDPHYFGVVANIRCAEALEQLSDMIYGE